MTTVATGRCWSPRSRRWHGCEPGWMGATCGRRPGLAEVAARPSRLMADAARTSARDADRVLDRARTVEAIPALGEALDAGTVTGGHVDAVGRVLRQLEPCHRDALAASAGWLVKLASTSHPGELHKALTVELDQLRAEDGVSRLARQRRATRLDTWIDDEGMWCLRGRFDPETGLKLHGRLANTVAALSPTRPPTTAPSTPSNAKRSYGPTPWPPSPRDTALAAACPRSSPSSTSPTPSPTGHPPSTGGSPSSCPPRCCAACSTPPTSTRSSCAAASCSTLPAASTWAAPPGWPTGPNAAPCAPSTRTCAIPGCDTRYDLCQLHHIIWWEHGGPTDLANLLPLCVRHHHAVHDNGWHLVLAADRSLTITYPDGTGETTPPPGTTTPATTRGHLPCRRHRCRPPAAHSCDADMSTTIGQCAPPVRPRRVPAARTSSCQCGRPVFGSTSSLSAWPGSTALPSGHSSATFTWRPIGTTIGVPETGSATTRQARSNTSRTSSSVTTSAGGPSATSAPSFMAIRWWA